jgi:hypothetical protein
MIGRMSIRTRCTAPPLRRIAIAAIFAALSIGSAAADETEFLQRFAGSWAGGGNVQRKAEEGPRRVTCKVRGNPSQNALPISGTCRAALIFTRKIGVDVRVDPGSGRYTGTYTGATIGPARVSGRRSGDVVTLTITWPKPVNGDTTASMAIRNDGAGRMSIVVTDEIDGRQVKTTEVTMSKSA